MACQTSNAASGGLVETVVPLMNTLLVHQALRQPNQRTRADNCILGLVRQHHGWLGFLASLALAGCALPRFEADEKDIPFSVHLMIESDNEDFQLSGANLEARLSKRDAEALGTEPTEPCGGRIFGRER